MKHLRNIAAVTATVALSIFGLSACSGTTGESAKSDSGKSVTVENCKQKLTFTKAPERVVLLKPAAITTLDKLGVLDKVVAKAGKYPSDLYSPELAKKVAAIPTITDKLDPSGHLDISKEMVIAKNPDLVLGFQKTVNAETMAGTGVNIAEEPALCGALTGDATWDDVYNQVTFYGKVFHKEKEAEAYIKELKKELEGIKIPSVKDKKVAILYPSIGGGPMYAYGRGSMASPLVEKAGLKNVYDDQKKRVFEVTGEDLVNRNPDIIIAAYLQGSPEEIAAEIKKLPGSESVNAVRNGKILTLEFPYVEPPTPMAVDGLKKIITYLESIK
ncbi:ABC transporter substrate-binding protein [Actinotignum urinale]|uniref:ABC transporter substrate-binding protein n=1 Tax=Actinotignum urinale TaxID=190146 RepID=UPI0003B6CF74|nr:ABC transporter substrate-binding protein [Actinotignum urinale]MDY5160964.1 ABC transporter substrate-binding protein [Actinotignum urinale]